MPVPHEIGNLGRLALRTLLFAAMLVAPAGIAAAEPDACVSAQPGSDAKCKLVGISVFGDSSGFLLAVSGTGSAYGNAVCSGICVSGAAISGTGYADSSSLAASGTGAARGLVAVSGTSTAYAGCIVGIGGVAVSGSGAATREAACPAALVAVSATCSAEGTVKFGPNSFCFDV